MLSKTKIKLFHSLRRKKTRDEKNLFVAEGKKCVLEILNSDFTIQVLVSTEEWINKHLNNNSYNILEIIPVTLDDLKKVSSFQSVGEVVIIASQPKTFFSISELNNELSLVLDDIQDPGNLGTIIRTASWFRINTIICSKNSVDIFNPKVVQSTMGALCKVNVHYVNLVDFLSEVSSSKSLPVYGTFLEGDNIYNAPLSNKGLIIMGNEGSGISDKLLPFITHRITIPSFSGKQIESLNVSSATAVICSEFKRIT